MEEELDGGGGAVPLLDRQAVGSQLSEKRAEAGAGGWWITELLAKAGVKAQPFVVLGVLKWWNPSVVESLLEGRR